MSSSNSQKRESNLVFRPFWGGCFHAGPFDGPAGPRQAALSPCSDLLAGPSPSKRVARIWAYRGKPGLPVLMECSQLQVRQYPNTRSPNTRELFFSPNKRHAGGGPRAQRLCDPPEDQALHIFPSAKRLGSSCSCSIPLMAPRRSLYVSLTKRGHSATLSGERSHRSE